MVPRPLMIHNSLPLFLPQKSHHYSLVRVVFMAKLRIFDGFCSTIFLFVNRFCPYSIQNKSSTKGMLRNFTFLAYSIQALSYFQQNDRRMDGRTLLDRFKILLGYIQNISYYDITRIFRPPIPVKLHPFCSFCSSLFRSSCILLSTERQTDGRSLLDRFRNLLGYIQNI